MPDFAVDDRPLTTEELGSPLDKSFAEIGAKSRYEKEEL